MSSASVHRTALRVLTLPALAWLGLCGWVWLAQRSLLYHPHTLEKSAAQELAASVGARALRDPHGQLLAWQFVGTQTCSSHWLMAHGNAGMALQRAYVAQRLREQLGPGACLSVIEYPGFGAAAGQPSRHTLVEQASAAWNALDTPPAVPRFLIGESLGTGVVAELAARFGPQVAGILLLTPYEDLAEVAASHFPWLPSRWLLRDRFEPMRLLRDYDGPVQLIVAGADRVIEPVHAQRLAAGLRNAHLHTEPGLDHNELEYRPHWWTLVQQLHAHGLTGGQRPSELEPERN